MQSYRQLDGQQILATLEQLRERITARFPDANLRRLCEQEVAVARDAIDCAEWLRRPHWPLRLGAGVAVVTLLTLLVAFAGITLRAPVNNADHGSAATSLVWAYERSSASYAMPT